MEQKKPMLTAIFQQMKAFEQAAPRTQLPSLDRAAGAPGTDEHERESSQKCRCVDTW